MQTTTWHHGLVAEWWSLFNTDGPEIAFYGRRLRAGRPVLDAGCGTGRLLVPWLSEGHDVDGCDAAPDMVERCRERAAAAGFAPTLWVQALHELDAPRRYGTAVACGVFGLASTRAEDAEALLRLHAALEPDGLLLLDNEVPYTSSMRWQRWPKEERGTLPEPWPEHGLVRQTREETTYELRTRAREVHPLDGSVVLEIRAERRTRDGAVVREEHALSMRGYVRGELVAMLERAGFRGIDVLAGYRDEPPTDDDELLVYAARA